MHTRRNPLIALLLVAALLFSACSSDGGDDAADDTTTTAADGESTTTEGEGGDDETTTTEGSGGSEGGDGPVDVSDDERPYVEAMAESMLEDEESEFPLTDDQAECFASRTVKVLRVDRLRAAGITPESLGDDEEVLEFPDLELTMDEGNEIYDAFGACGVDLREAMLADMASDDEMGPGAAACIEGVFTEENLRLFFVTLMVKGEDAMEDDPAVASVMGGLIGCAFMGMGESMEDGDGDTGSDLFEEVGESISAEE